MLIFSEFGVKVKSEIPQLVRLLLPRDTAKSRGQAADLLCAGLGSFGCQMVIFNIMTRVSGKVHTQPGTLRGGYSHIDKIKYQ